MERYVFLTDNPGDKPEYLLSMHQEKERELRGGAGARKIPDYLRAPRHYHVEPLRARPISHTLAHVPRGTTVVIKRAVHLDLDIEALLYTLRARKLDDIMIRILDPNIVIDPNDDGTSIRTLEFFKELSALRHAPISMEEAPAKGFGRDSIEPRKIEGMRYDRQHLGTSIRDLAKKYGVCRKTVEKYTKGVKKPEMNGQTHSRGYLHQMDLDENGGGTEDKLRRHDPIYRFSFTMLAEFPVAEKIKEHIYDWIRIQRTENTRSSYAKGMKFFLEWYAVRNKRELRQYSEFNYGLAEEFITWLRDEKDQKISAIKSKFYAIKSFLNYARVKGFVPANYWDLIKLPVDGSRSIKTKPFTEAEAEKLVEAAFQDWKLAKKSMEKAIRHRNFVIIWLLARHGPRIYAILKLKKKDFFHRHGKVWTLRLHDKKGGNYFINPGRDTVEVLLRYIEIYLPHQPENAFLFPVFRYQEDFSVPLSYASFYQWFKNFAEKHVPESHGDKVPHAFRTTFATESRRRGTNPEEIRIQLGHKTLDQTLKYIELVEEEPASVYKPNFSGSKSFREIAGGYGED